MKANGISVSERSIALLFKDLDAGRFAIPRLQREFVWNGPKAAKLLGNHRTVLRAPVGELGKLCGHL